MEIKYFNDTDTLLVIFNQNEKYEKRYFAKGNF